MRSLLLFFVLVVGLQGTLQETAESSRNNKTGSDGRTHIGTIVYWVDEEENTARSPPQPALLINNSTARYLSGTLSTKILPTFHIMVLIMGVPPNIAILYSLLTKLHKVSATIQYCSLAVSDLLLLLSLLFKAYYHLHGNDWQFGETACRVMTACFYGNLYCSAQMLTCISINRYLAVAHPFMYRSLPKRRITGLVCLVNWVVFVAAVVPELVVKQTYLVPELDLITCHDVLPLRSSSHEFLLYYNIALTIFGLLLPLVATVWSYSRIIRELNRSHLDWARYIKASLLMLVIFLVCFTPAAILHLLHYVSLSVDGTEGLYAWFNVAVCLCCAHACLDPFLFLLMSRSTSHMFNLQQKSLSSSDTKSQETNASLPRV